MARACLAARGVSAPAYHRSHLMQRRLTITTTSTFSRSNVINPVHMMHVASAKCQPVRTFADVSKSAATWFSLSNWPDSRENEKLCRLQECKGLCWANFFNSVVRKYNMLKNECVLQKGLDISEDLAYDTRPYLEHIRYVPICKKLCSITFVTALYKPD